MSPYALQFAHISLRAATVSHVVAVYYRFFSRQTRVFHAATSRNQAKFDRNRRQRFLMPYISPWTRQFSKNINVTDIGGSRILEDLGKKCSIALADPNATLPDGCLYVGNGLRIWNEITYTPEFYQTSDEIAIFDKHGEDLVGRLQQGVTLIDLGAGDSRKVEHLLAALEKKKRKVDYFALDICQTSLKSSLNYLVGPHSRNKNVKCTGLWGTFQDGLTYVKGLEGQRLFLSLGSVLCNDPWPEALAHLRSWAKELRQDDFLLIGMDGHLLPEHKDKIWAAYHSQEGLYRQLFLNGFKQVNKAIGEEFLQEDDWDFMAQLEDKPTTRHRFFFRAKKDIAIHKLDRIIKEGEVLDWFDSHKYGEDSVRQMCNEAGLTLICVWQAPKSEYRESSII